MVNITFKMLNGTVKKDVLPDNFGYHDLFHLTERLLGKEAVNEWMFMVKAKQFQMTDAQRVNALMPSMTDPCTIMVVRRSASGTFMPAHQFTEKFVGDVAAALNTMTNRIHTTCPICQESGRLCSQLSCGKCSATNVLCNECFIAYLKISDLRYRCISCRKIIEILTIFPNVPAIYASLNTFNEMRHLQLNIDCQICLCGEAKVNALGRLISKEIFS